MGAVDFHCHAQGKDVQEAFGRAVQDARYDYGHAGYTGTIAEKSSYTLFDLPEGMTPRQFYDLIYDEGECPQGHEQLIERAREVYNDKWGPCVAIRADDNSFIFMGIASY